MPTTVEASKLYSLIKEVEMKLPNNGNSHQIKPLILGVGYFILSC